MSAIVNVYSTDIRYAHLAEQKLNADGWPVTRIEEWYEDGQQVGYRVHGEEHQGSRRVEVEEVALTGFRRNLWGFVAVGVGVVGACIWLVGLITSLEWLTGR